LSPRMRSTDAFASAKPETKRVVRTGVAEVVSARDQERLEDCRTRRLAKRLSILL
jgi:hypothetical protein